MALDDPYNDYYCIARILGKHIKRLPDVITLLNWFFCWVQLNEYPLEIRRLSKIVSLNVSVKICELHVTLNANFKGTS